MPWLNNGPACFLPAVPPPPFLPPRRPRPYNCDHPDCCEPVVQYDSDEELLKNFIFAVPCTCEDYCHCSDFLTDYTETPVPLQDEKSTEDDFIVLVGEEDNPDGGLAVLIDENTIDTSADHPGTGNNNQGESSGNGSGNGSTDGEDEEDDGESDVPAVCEITPLEAFLSTNLNSRIESYKDLSDRILHMLGYPSVAITDLHVDQINDAISMACEFYSRYAGYTFETMVFDSRLYKRNVGIHLGQLFTVASIDAEQRRWANPMWINRGPDQQQEWPQDVYVTKKFIPRSAYFISEREFNVLMCNCRKTDQEIIEYLHYVSVNYPSGIDELSVISDRLYRFLIDRRGFKKEDFKKSKDKVFTQGGVREELYKECERHGKHRLKHKYRKTYDYDIMDYRKVISVVSFQEMTSMSPLSLFAGISGLAEQTYFAWEFNNKGFSLLERHCLGEWLDMRNKILAMDRRWNFDKYTQYLTLSPQPHTPCPTTAVIEAYVERPLRDIIKDPWVFKYALAQCKIIIGNIRGKWGDVQLLGGGVVSGNRFTQEGIQEVKELEQTLIEKGGYSSALGPVFVIG